MLNSLEKKCERIAKQFEKKSAKEILNSLKKKMLKKC